MPIDGIHRSQPDALVFVNLLGGDMASPAAAMAWWGSGPVRQSGRPPACASLSPATRRARANAYGPPSRPRRFADHQYVDSFIETVKPDLLCFDLCRVRVALAGLGCLSFQLGLEVAALPLMLSHATCDPRPPIRFLPTRV